MLYPWAQTPASPATEQPHVLVIDGSGTDVMEMYCSPSELEKYYKFFGNAASGVDSP
jgi:hypothetical protein